MIEYIDTFHQVMLAMFDKHIYVNKDFHQSLVLNIERIWLYQ